MKTFIWSGFETMFLAHSWLAMKLFDWLGPCIPLDDEASMTLQCQSGRDRS
jgi:hypothetical protein